MAREHATTTPATALSTTRPSRTSVDGSSHSLDATIKSYSAIATSRRASLAVTYLMPMPMAAVTTASQREPNSMVEMRPLLLLGASLAMSMSDTSLSTLAFVSMSENEVARLQVDNEKRCRGRVVSSLASRAPLGLGWPGRSAKRVPVRFETAPPGGGGATTLAGGSE
jgi:hypothetical protein